MDDYFNFDEASAGASQSLGTSCSSGKANADEADAGECFESLFFDKSTSLPVDNLTDRLPGIDTTFIPSVPAFSLEMTDGTYPMHRAKEPCDLCKQRGLDCFVAQRGVMLHGCTCCISLYRQCSFTHKKTPGLWMATLDPVNEDVQKDSGNLVGRFQSKSLSFQLDDSKSRKTGPRFSRDAVKALKNWLAAHAHHPYPTDQEKDELKHLTGLKRSQISNWLANARRRGKVRPVSEDTHSGAVDIPYNPANNIPNWESLNPLERWKHSPPEHEPATMTDIAKAVSDNPYPEGGVSSESSANRSRQNSSHHQSSSNDESNFSMFQEPSISSLAQSEQSSVSSLHSSYSRGSLKERKDRRRRRRAPLPNRLSNPQKPRADRIFQCTFCTDSFAAKYDWARHEKSLHLALERWTCSPAGGVFEEEGIRRCYFCLAINPDEAHLETHNFGACEEKTIPERTFYRKDHLRQHLRLLHGATYNPKMEAWKSHTTSIKSRCGFCPAEFSTWGQRVDHLAAHFKNGSDMSKWQGTWGFEPYVDRLVENAMPPFIIAEDRISVNPFVATRRTSSTSSEAQTCGRNMSSSATGSSPNDMNAQDQWYADSNCWRRCEMLLSKYIQEERVAGRVPTDAQLQVYARRVIYGDDDPWNQSPADNKQWLALIKKQNDFRNGENEDLEPPKQANGETCMKPEQLPMDPPYCIPGGLKRARRTDSAQASTSHRASSLPKVATSCPETPSVAFSNDIAVDQLDLSALDLALIDDSLDLTNVDLNAYAAGEGARQSSGPGTTSINDVFLGNEMELDVNLPAVQSSLEGGVASRPSGQRNAGEDFHADIDHLTGYMQSFRH